MNDYIKKFKLKTLKKLIKAILIFSSRKNSFRNLYKLVRVFLSLNVSPTADEDEDGKKDVKDKDEEGKDEDIYKDKGKDKDDDDDDDDNDKGKDKNDDDDEDKEEEYKVKEIPEPMKPRQRRLTMTSTNGQQFSGRSSAKDIDKVGLYYYIPNKYFIHNESHLSYSYACWSRCQEDMFS